MISVKCFCVNLHVCGFVIKYKALSGAKASNGWYPSNFHNFVLSAQTVSPFCFSLLRSLLVGYDERERNVGIFRENLRLCTTPEGINYLEKISRNI
jgi:hypothetical protein